MEHLLGVPVAATSADSGEGLDALMEKVRGVCDGFHAPARGQEAWEASDEAARRFVLRAQEIAEKCVTIEKTSSPTKTERLDAVFLHRVWGYVVLLLLLLGVFWLTIEGANYPSQGLQWCFDRMGELLHLSLIHI